MTCPFQKIICRPDLGGHANIFMMEAANTLELDHHPLLWRLDRPAVRRILLQRQMRPHAVIIIGIAGEDAFQMKLSQDNHVIQTFSAYRADDPLSIGILPR